MSWEDLFYHFYRQFTGCKLERAQEVYNLNKAGIERYKADGMGAEKAAFQVARYNLELPRRRRGCRS